MKNIIKVVLIGFISFNTYAQNFAWANKGGLWAYDYGYGVATDNAGNVYVSGKYEEAAIFSGVTLPWQGNHDAFLAKYSPSGDILWITTCGGPGGDYAQAIACDGSNYVYMGGEIEGYGDQILFPGSAVTLTTKGDNDLFLAKYDLSGHLVWAMNEGGINSEKVLSIATDNAGNVFICGYYESGTTFNGGPTINGNGHRDIYVAKYDAGGNFKWVQKAGSAGRDEAKGIKCDMQGNVYICGMYSNGCTFGLETLTSANGYYDAFIAKYSSGGNLLWVTTAGGDYDEVAWSLAIDNAGKIFVTGEFNASAYFGSTQLITTGNANVFIACYDAAGNTLWAKGAGGPLIDRARGIGTNGSQVFITGQFGATATFGSKSITAADSSDVFFVSCDNSGNFISALSAGGPADAYEPLGYESGISICGDASGNVYATGGMLDGAVFGSTSLNAYSRTDVYVTKISQFVGIDAYAGKKNELRVYPNPSSGHFTIEQPAAENQRTDITIYNNLGEIVKQTSETLLQFDIDLSANDNGVYIIEMQNGLQNRLRQKLVVSK